MKVTVKSKPLDRVSYAHRHETHTRNGTTTTHSNQKKLPEGKPTRKHKTGVRTHLQRTPGPHRHERTKHPRAIGQEGQNPSAEPKKPPNGCKSHGQGALKQSSNLGGKKGGVRKCEADGSRHEATCPLRGKPRTEKPQPEAEQQHPKGVKNAANQKGQEAPRRDTTSEPATGHEQNATPKKRKQAAQCDEKPETENRQKTRQSSPRRRRNV